jgi:hypothetical protein
MLGAEARGGVGADRDGGDLEGVQSTARQSSRAASGFETSKRWTW